MYCEPPKIFKDKQCKDEISVEKWQEVVKNYPNDGDDAINITMFVYDKNEINLFKGGGSIRIIYEEVNETLPIVIMETQDREYRIFKIDHLDCHQIIEDSQNSIKDQLKFRHFFVAHLMSIVCYSFILAFFLTAKQMRSNIHGKCWIHFLINSMINYVCAAFALFIEILNVDICKSH
jgi:hypothetical protein